MVQSSQKFIARNRAPRVQIEYDVELYGAEKKIQLPFVMGVLADTRRRAQSLSGSRLRLAGPFRTSPRLSKRELEALTRRYVA